MFLATWREIVDDSRGGLRPSFGLGPLRGTALYKLERLII